GDGDKPAKGKGGRRGNGDARFRALASERFGDQLSAYGRSQGATDKAIDQALIEGGKKLDEGASFGIAYAAARAKLESLGGGLSDRPVNDLLLEAVGLTPGRPTAPGAPSPVTGASFVRVDNSFTAPTTITIEIDAADVADFDSKEFADAVGRRVAEVIDDRNKQLYDRTRMQTVP